MMTRKFRAMFNGMRLAVLSALVSVGAVQTAQAQETSVEKDFTVCALNVDGLPNKILGITINPDGKGADGAIAIGYYLRDKGVDVVALSEDFNYHSYLVAPLSATGNYSFGTWRGEVNAREGLNPPINTDGLGLITKNATCTFRNEQWGEWNEHYGLYTNGADGLIRKGYRYYTIDLGDNMLVDLYIVHMEADSETQDIAARETQWTQIYNVIRARNSGRPVIVMGDTNSRYTRENILGLFTNQLSNDYDVRDAWVQLCKNNTYPAYPSASLMVGELGYKEGEVVDKVLYLNPKSSTYKLTAETILFDVDGYKGEDGTSMGDHMPLIVGFKASGTVQQYAKVEPNNWWRGEALTHTGQQAYVFNVASQVFVTDDQRPTVKDINNAPLWSFWGGDGKYSVSTGENGWRLRMEWNAGKVNWEAKVVSGSGATTFEFVQSGTTEGAYKLKNTRSIGLEQNRLRYFSLDENGDYNAANTADTHNDWLLISQTQKETYDRYVSLFDEAKGFYDDPSLDLPSDLQKELEKALEDATNSNYNNSTEVNRELEDIINKIKNYKYLDVRITDAHYATVCLPWNGTVPAGVTVYKATEYKVGNPISWMHLEEVSATVLPKGEGFVLYSETPGTYRFVYTDEDAATYPDNILVGTYTKLENADLNFDDFDYIGLGNKSAGVGFYFIDETSYIPAYRAFLKLAKTDNSAEHTANARVAFTFGGETTGIGDATQPAADAQPAAVYGVSGALRSQLERGLNIVKMSDGTVRKVWAK